MCLPCKVQFLLSALSRIEAGSQGSQARGKAAGKGGREEKGKETRRRKQQMLLAVAAVLPREGGENLKRGFFLTTLLACPDGMDVSALKEGKVCVKPDATC